MNRENFLYENCQNIGVSLNQEQIGQFMQFYEYLIKKNEVMNLTAITEYEDVVIKHFVDSLSLVKAVPQISNRKLQVLDLGSGAGFPGIPLKIAFPDLNILLLDSLKKRVNFMNEVIDLCGLSGIQAVHGRAEEMANGEYREHFDLCVSRAVANLSTLSEYCLPFVKISGLFTAYKTSAVEGELEAAQNAIHILGGKAREPYVFTLGGEYGRSLAVIDKISASPKKYPRKSGIPSRMPL